MPRKIHTPRSMNQPARRQRKNREQEPRQSMRAEVLSALEKASASGRGRHKWVTFEEVAKRADVPEDKIRRKLNRAAREGEVERRGRGEAAEYRM